MIVPFDHLTQRSIGVYFVVNPGEAGKHFYTTKQTAALWYKSTPRRIIYAKKRIIRREWLIQQGPIQWHPALK